MKFGCYPPLKTVISHNNKGGVLPPESAGVILYIICAAPSLQLGAVLLKSLRMQDFCFDIIICIFIIDVHDLHHSLNIPFGIVSALRTCGIKTDRLRLEGLSVEVNRRCIWQYK